MTLKECVDEVLKESISDNKLSMLFDAAIIRIKSLMEDKKIKENKILLSDLKNRIETFERMKKKYSNFEKKYLNDKSIKEKYNKEVKKDKEIIKMAKAFKNKDAKKTILKILGAIGGTGAAVGTTIAAFLIKDFKDSIIGKFLW